MRKIIITLVSLLITTHAFADLSLDNDASHFFFLSTKNNKVTETHHFKALQGSISKTGSASLTIDLSSVETNIPIRNERMLKFLFNVEKYPTAAVTVNFDNALLSELVAGSVINQTFDAEITLHGVTKTLATPLTVTKLSSGAITVTNQTPIIINATEFALDTGIEELQKIAKLDAIAITVPVSFQLTYLP